MESSRETKESDSVSEREQSSPQSAEEEEKREGWFEGISADFMRRAPLYPSDWSIGSPREARKIFAATLFAYFTSVLPAVIFGDQLNLATESTYGLPEVLVSTGGLGILYSFFAGQGLVIVGVTGPVVFFQLTVWTLAVALKAPFLQLNAWINIWCGLLHFLVAAGGYTSLVQRVTSFSGEIFGFFISVAYIYLGIQNIVDLFPANLDSVTSTSVVEEGEKYADPIAVQLASAFASVVLASLMYLGAVTCHHAKQWRSLNDLLRWFASSFGMVVTIVICTAISYAHVFSNPHIDLQRLQVPTVKGGSSFSRKGPIPSESSSRTGWVLHLMGSDGNNTMELWMVFAAIGPAVMLLILFFFDHNVSSIMAQDPKFNLKKPSAYNLDFAVLGFGVVLCGIFGLPPGNGLIPQAPLHVRALAVIEYEATPSGAKREIYAAVVEKRWSNFLQSTMCLLTVFLFPVIKLIPQSVLSGTFLYMGVSGFFGNGLWERLGCMLMQKQRRPDFVFVRSVRWRKVVRYTAIQFVAVSLIFLVSFNFFMPEGSPPVAVAFPLFIAVLIPLRELWLPTLFSEADLAVLDPPSDQAEDLAQKEEDYKRTKPPLDPEDSFRANHSWFHSLPRVQGAVRSLHRATSDPT